MSDTGLTQWQVVLDAAPASADAFTTVAALRDSVRKADPRRWSADGRTGIRHQADRGARPEGHHPGDPDRGARGALCAAPRGAGALVLVAATALSTLAALGMGSWVSIHLLGFPALDNTTPLFAFLFLVALGVDYTIFR